MFYRECSPRSAFRKSEVLDSCIFNLHVNSSSPSHFSPAEIAIFSVTVIVVAFAAFILGALSEKMEYYVISDLGFSDKPLHGILKA